MGKQAHGEFERMFWILRSAGQLLGGNAKGVERIYSMTECRHFLKSVRSHGRDRGFPNDLEVFFLFEETR